jgi:hypothetical protein
LPTEEKLDHTALENKGHALHTILHLPTEARQYTPTAPYKRSANTHYFWDCALHQRSDSTGTGTLYTSPEIRRDYKLSLIACTVADVVSSTHHTGTGTARDIRSDSTHHTAPLGRREQKIFVLIYSM